MAKIFVSYRRQDSLHFTRVLKTRIEGRFGKKSIFRDLDNIPIGVNFRKHAEAAISQCQAMLLVIGDKWLATGDTGKSRLFDPHDTLRMEIETALAREVPIVPVLVENARMPAMEDLPDEIKQVASLNAARVHDADFEHHMTRLEGVLEKLLKRRPAATPVVKTNLVAKKSTTRLKNRKVSPRLTLTNLRRAFKDSANTYVGSSIPRNKLYNAVGAYGLVIEPNEVLALYDDTTFGGAKNGFMLTKTTLHWQNLAAGSGFLDFSDLKRVTHTPKTVNVNGRSISVSEHSSAAALTRLLKGMIKSRS